MFIQDPEGKTKVICFFNFLVFLNKKNKKRYHEMVPIPMVLKKRG